MHKFSSVVCVFMKIVGAYIDFAKRNHHLHNEKRMKHKGVMNFEKNVQAMLKELNRAMKQYGEAIIKIKSNV